MCDIPQPVRVCDIPQPVQDDVNNVETAGNIHVEYLDTYTIFCVPENIYFLL